MIYFWLIAGLLVVSGSLAAVIVRERRKSEAAIGVLRARERVLAERISKIELALSDKTTVTESRHLTMMVDGVASICRRQEDRLAAIESQIRESRSAGGDN